MGLFKDFFNARPAKATPVAADKLIISDSEAAGVLKTATPAGLVAAGNAIRKLSTTTISTDSILKQPLYTVPAGNQCVVTNIILRDVSTSMAAADAGISFGFNAGTDNYANLSGTAIVNLTSDSKIINFSNLVPSPPDQEAMSGFVFTVGTAGDVFGALVTFLVADGTIEVDVFGYLY